MIDERYLEDIRRWHRTGGLDNQDQVIDRWIETTFALWKVARAAKQADKLMWYDPSNLEGACLWCEANLHPNAMGKHQQLNGAFCPIQLLHDSVALLNDGGGENG